MRKIILVPIITLLTSYLICACNDHPKLSNATQATTNVATGTTKENTATPQIQNAKSGVDSIISAKISSLPEFDSLLKYNDEDGPVSISISPRIDEHDYLVEVGRRHPDRLKIIYNFVVITNDYQVYYYDTGTDSVITLEQWRQNNQSEQ